MPLVEGERGSVCPESNCLGTTLHTEVNPGARVLIDCSKISAIPSEESTTGADLHENVKDTE